jgi:carbonic anhydrase/acetyltransferase-like protein (isoleucine patch superfamily)
MSMTENNDTSNFKDIDNSIDITKIPITTNAFKWTFSSSLLYLMLHFLTIVMPTVMVLTFFSFAMDSNLFSWRISLIFIDILAWWGAYLLISLLLGKLFLVVLKLIHKPQEGFFKIDRKDKDYSHFCLRVTVKKFIFLIWNNFCFPWVNNYAFKMCDIKADFKSTMFDGWSDVEFIEFGNNIMIGQGAQVLSAIIVRLDNVDYLLLKKVIVGDHVVLGANSIVSPGTIIGKGATLGVWTITHINQILDPDWIYIGNPAQKYQPAQKAIADSKKQPMRRLVGTGERIKFDIKQFSNQKPD